MGVDPGGPPLRRVAPGAVLVRLPWLATIVALSAAACDSPSTPAEAPPDVLDAPVLLDALLGVDTPAGTDAPDALDLPVVTDAPAVIDAPVAPDVPVVTDAPVMDVARPPEDTGPAAPDNDRVLTFRNNCPTLSVQVGATGGYVRECGPGGACPEGTRCLSERMPPACFWVLPAPARGSADLRPGESATYVLHNAPLGHVLWSGNVYGRTGCGTGACETGACPGGACRPGVGPLGPTTLAEFTLLDNGPDYYDVSLINGINLPLAMTADPAGLYGPPPAAPGDAYWCGGAGEVTPTHRALAGCTWAFDPTIAATNRAPVLRLVAGGGAACTSDAGCSAGSVCGTSAVAGTTRVAQTCGRQLGWWTAHELCGATAGAYGAPLDCSAAAPSGAGTRANLFGCNGPDSQSCYTAGAAATCCGCADWPYAATQSCRAHNPDWNAVALPWVRFVKGACPTAYSYQFDDMTSTFTCQTRGATNGADYTVTFCPGARRGF